MARRVPESPEYDYEDNEVGHPHELSKQERAERVLLIATLLISASIIICMSLLVVLLVLLDPIDVATSLESEGYVDIAGALRDAAAAMKGGS